MSTHLILDEFRNRTGWNTQSCLIVVGRYIDAQQGHEAYLDHLRETADEENAFSESGTPEGVTTEDELAAYQGWSDETLLGLMLSYIEAQQSHDTFRDHLSEAEAEEVGMAAGE